MSEPLIYPWDVETKVQLPPRRPQLDQRATKLAGAPRYMPCACATEEAPPKAKASHVVQRIDGVWVQVQHRRGETVYDKATGAARKIGDNEIGVPDSMTTLEPGLFDKWDEKRGRWAEDASLKAAHELDARRAEAQEAARQRVANVDATDISPMDLAIVLGLREPSVSE